MEQKFPVAASFFLRKLITQNRLFILIRFAGNQRISTNFRSTDLILGGFLCFHTAHHLAEGSHFEREKTYGGDEPTLILRALFPGGFSARFSYR